MAGSIYRVVCANGDARRYKDGRTVMADTPEAIDVLKRTWDLADTFKTHGEQTGPHRVQRSYDDGATWNDVEA